MFSQQVIPLDEFKFEILGREMITGHDDLHMTVEMEIDSERDQVENLEVTLIHFGNRMSTENLVQPNEYPMIWDAVEKYARSIEDRLKSNAYDTEAAR